MRGKKKKNPNSACEEVTVECVHKCKLHLPHLNSSCKEMHNCLNGYHCQGYNPCCKSTQKNGFTCFIHFLSYLAQLIGASFSVENNLCVKKIAYFSFTMLCQVKWVVNSFVNVNLTLTLMKPAMARSWH